MCSVNLWTKYADVKANECDASSMSYTAQFFDHMLGRGRKCMCLVDHIL